MKTIRLFITTLLCTATTVAASAQDNLIKAIDDFVGNKSLVEYIKVSTYTENKNGGAKPTSYMYQYKFELPMNKKKELSPVLAAFNKDTGVAYQVHTKDAGLNDNPLVEIAYGEKLNKSRSYGSYKNRNYRLMLVGDKQDSLRRYFYGIIWYEDEKNNKLCGSIEKIYGPNPQKVKKDYYYGNLASLENLNLDALEQLKGLDKLKELDALNNLGNNTGAMLDGDSLDSRAIKTSTDFLRRFGSLRTTFKKSSGNSKYDLRTVLANKIVELCRTHGILLNQDERKFCINSLKDMQAMEWDKYIRGLLDIAISSLKK